MRIGLRKMFWMMEIYEKKMIDMNPLVSICVPVYGVENFIDKCCRSLFEQTYDNIEYIFVDDCTPDNSIAVVEQVLCNYPNRKGMVKVIHHGQNKGLSGARNTAIANVSGQYLMHVDSDDYLDLNVVEKLVNKAQSENADVVLYDMRYVYPNKQVIVHQNVPNNKMECVMHTLIYKISVCVCGGLYLSSLFKKTDVKFIEGLNYGEDYVVKPRVLYYAHKIVHCEHCYYNYVQYNVSSYSNLYHSKNVDDLIRAIGFLNSFFQNKEDYEVYKEALNAAHLLVKCRLLIAICLHRESIWNRFPMVARLYSELHISKNIPFSYRVMLYLVKFRLYKLFCIYVSYGFKVKQLLKL